MLEMITRLTRLDLYLKIIRSTSQPLVDIEHTDKMSAGVSERDNEPKT